MNILEMKRMFDLSVKPAVATMATTFTGKPDENNLSILAINAAWRDFIRELIDYDMISTQQLILVKDYEIMNGDENPYPEDTEEHLLWKPLRRGNDDESVNEADSNR